MHDNQYDLFNSSLVLFIRPVSLKKSNRTGQSGIATTVQIKRENESWLYLQFYFVLVCVVLFNVVFIYFSCFIFISVNRIIFSLLVLVLVLVFVNYDKLIHTDFCLMFVQDLMVTEIVTPTSRVVFSYNICFSATSSI